MTRCAGSITSLFLSTLCQPERLPASFLHSSKRRTLIRVCALATLELVPALTGLTHAQQRPGKKPITLVVGSPAGGSADMIARTIAEPLSKHLGTPIVVENISGAGGPLRARK